MCWIFLQAPCYKGKYKHGEHCELFINTTARCSCPLCHFRYKPVCGTDRRSYINHCFLRRQACLTKTPILVAQHGRCCKSAFLIYSYSCYSEHPSFQRWYKEQGLKNMDNVTRTTPYNRKWMKGENPFSYFMFLSLFLTSLLCASFCNPSQHAPAPAVFLAPNVNSKSMIPVLRVQMKLSSGLCSRIWKQQEDLLNHRALGLDTSVTNGTVSLAHEGKCCTNSHLWFVSFLPFCFEFQVQMLNCTISYTS